VAAFIDFVLNHLPPPPRQVLEVGCGEEGGLVAALVAAGYDAVGVDPSAPEGARFVRARFQDLEPGGGPLRGIEAVVAGRVLHHVRPLDEGLDRLAALAPLLLVDEFAADLIDPPGEDWYEGQHRLLRIAGADPPGPPDLDAWGGRHPDLHPHDVLLAGLRERYEERALEWLPYYHRWLGGPSSEALEETLVGVGAFRAIGWRWAGLRRGDPAAL
jgi:hypothetical protein